MNRIFCSIFSLSCLMISIVKAQEQPIPGTQADDKLIIVPNDQAMAAKKKLLGKITQERREGGRPANVVLILADDLGYADTSSYGSKTIPRRISMRWPPTESDLPTPM